MLPILKHRPLLGFIATCVLSACAMQAPQSQVDIRMLGQMTGNAPICVLVPVDASYFGKRSPGSGNEIASRIRGALNSIKHPSLQISQLENNAHEQCAERGAKLFIKTDVLRYEVTKDGLLGKPDHVQIKLSLYGLENLDSKKSIIYETKSNLTFGNVLGGEFEQAVWKLVDENPGVATQADSFGLD